MKNLLKHSILCTIFLTVAREVYSQQTAEYTLNSFNKYIVNPAIAGTEDFLEIEASYRTQWTGLKGAPKTLYLTAHSPLGRDHGTAHNHRKNERQSWFGVGGSVTNDVAGPISRLTAFGTGSYNIKLSQNLRASFGLSLGIQNFSFDGTDVELASAQDVLFNTTNSQILPDAQAGVWLYSESFYFGFSGQQLLNNELNITESAQSLNEGSLNRHYAIATGVNIPAGDKINIYPSVLIRAVTPAPVTVDFGIRGTYDNKYWMGLFTRTGDSFSVALGGLFLKSYSITYGYDFNYSDLSPFNGGSHEILLGYRIPPKQKLDCPSKFWN